MIACEQVSETAHALHLSIFEQPAFIGFFNNLLMPRTGCFFFA
jgi:hypothetical protein